ncbi:glycosyltransferase family 39 protein [Leptolyngbya sp. FACHB-671]|uniref:ArnT family glycosyltransferase n=1 Tax=Leptolyngbya sp. FACHB-671 TaxID=2692812 RepID=UPI001685BC5F|nr:glycosyltransferase family 39 protein [Leptolyngbya sp. FACHB-671]MBD2066806.1 glycosyltransferase family 39 protein [Leptolyngbya sp. FACHB-671]
MTTANRSNLLLRRTLFAVMGLVILCVFLFLWRLGSYSLFNVTEARQAEVARQIWVRQDWVTPVYNGKFYFDKPILLHWLIALGFPIFGVGEWAVRLPSAISAIALVLSTWLFTVRFATQRMALLAATMIAANPFTFALGRTGQHDMLLVFFMTAALYCWYWAYSTRQKVGYLLFFGLLAFAVLAKGPLALILSGLIIGIFLVWVNRWQKQLTSVPWGWGILIFAGITLPWHLLAFQANGWYFINSFFVFSNVTRFVSVNQNQAGPWYYYLLCVAIGFFPWLVLIPSAINWQSLRQWLRLDYWRQQDSNQQVSLFMGIWFVTVLVFMSAAATKLLWYVYPGIPALAYLCAQAWEQQISEPKRSLKFCLGFISLVYALLAVGFTLVPHLVDQPFLQTAEITQIIWQWFLLYSLATVAIAISLIRVQPLWAWLVGVGTFSLFALTVVDPLLPTLDGQVLGGRLIPVAQALQQEICEECDRDLPAALGVTWPSLNFYSQINRIERFKKPCETQMQLKRDQRLLLVTTDEEMQRANLDLSDYQPTYVSDVFKLFIIPPDDDLAQRQCLFNQSKSLLKPKSDNTLMQSLD